MTEYAMIMKADGSQVSHPAARQRAVEFLRALAAQPTAAAPIGRDGKPQAWNRERGFHDALADPAATTIERRAASAKPLDPALARRVALEETRSLCRRAERARREQLIRESRALIVAADRRLDAPLTDQGQIVSAIRRGGLR